MINLLPDGYRRNIRAARANVLLVRYNILLFIVIVASILLLVGVYYVMTNEKMQAERRTAENNQAVNSFSDIKTRSDTFKNELSQARQQIDGGVHYAAILAEISRILPTGTAIEQLQLTSSEIGQSKTLTVLVVGESQAYQLRDNFQKSSYFSAISFGGVSQNTGVTAEQYPFVVNLQFTILPGAGAS